MVLTASWRCPKRHDGGGGKQDTVVLAIVQMAGKLKIQQLDHAGSTRKTLEFLR
jgi:hypothetical protein